MKKVLVIPFRVDQTIDGADYLEEGIVEELIDFISDTNGMTVLGRNLSLYLKQHPRPGNELAQEFGIHFMVEGSLRKVDDQAQITMRLVRASSEEVVASQKAFLDLENWSSQVSKLMANLLGHQSKSTNHSSETGFKKNARELYLKGIYHWNRYSYNEMKLAIGFFEKALRIDPNFAPAYAGLADCYTVIAVMGHEKPNPAYQKALEYVNEALSLNNKHSGSYQCAALLNLFYQKDYERAKLNLDLALKLNSNHSNVYHLLSYYHAFTREFDLSEQHCLNAIQYDPLSIPAYAMLIRLAIYRKNFSKSLEIIDAALIIDPGSPPILEFKGLTFLLSGNVESAIETYTHCLKASPNNLLNYGFLSYALSKSNFYAESLEIERELEQTSVSKETGNYDHAMAIIKLGRKNYSAFFQHVNKAIDVGFSGIVGDVYNNPMYSEIRKDARYQAFLKRSNLDAENYLPSKSRRPSSLISIQSNTKEKLQLDPQDIAFVKGDGNYCTIYQHENGLLTQVVLRVTLKQLEAQLKEYPYLVRCHKSFVVNLTEQLSLYGNAKGHFFQSPYFPIRIPISRSKSHKLKRQLEEHS